MVSQIETVLWSIIVVVALVGGVVMIGQPAGANHGGDSSYDANPPSDHTEQTWDSVWWGYGPNAHETGAEESGWAFRSTPNDANGDQFGDLEYYQYVAIHAPWADMSNCAVTDTDVAGIDRGDDNWDGEPYDPGNDDSVVQDIQDSGIFEHYGYFQFAGPDDFSDRGINLNTTDAFTAGLECFSNPEEEGWYRLTVWFNGTTYEGDYAEWKGFNEWKYFCDDAAERCSDRDEAIETLGPPPTEFDYPSGERVQNYEPDTPWSHTSGPPEESEDSEEDGAEETPEGADEETPEDGAEETPEGADEETPEDGDEEAPEDGDAETPEDGDEEAPEDGDAETPEDGDEEAPEDGAEETPEPADEEAPPEDGDDPSGGDGEVEGEEPDGEGTPTAGDGPGLGPIVALVALLAAALLARRGR